jgi:hypothetical protein
MAQPPTEVRYGDKVVTVPQQFASITKDIKLLTRQVNVLSLVIGLHLIGADTVLGANLANWLKLIGV